MEMLRLPPRLAMMAQLVPGGARLVDVGTDHGLLPIFLLLNCKIESAIATDIRRGPLDRAISNAAAHNITNITFRLCDGLSAVTSDEADTITIAGMGGENIADILARAPWARSGKRLILQPMSRPEVFRKALRDLGLHILSEVLVEDTGRLYSIIVAEGGPADFYTEAEFYTGLFSQVGNSPLFERLLREQTARLTPALKGLERSRRYEDSRRLLTVKKILDDFEAARREYLEGF